MSNLIKYQFVNFQKQDSFLVDPEKKGENFVPVKESHVLIRPLEEVEQEEKEKEAGGLIKKEKKTEKSSAPEKSADEFTTGVPVVHMDEVIEEKKKQAELEAGQIVLEAQEQAQAILSRAESEAEQIRNAAHEEGIEAGKSEGMSLAQSEIADIRAKLDEESDQLQREYQSAVNEMEPRYVDILCSLIRKITGVMMDEQKDVLLYLIREAMAEMEPSERYTVRVAPEDAMSLETHRKELTEKLGEVTVDIQEDKGLAKDECIIETDHQMVDCGVRTQLDNLITTLRMLAQGKDN